MKEEAKISPVIVTNALSFKKINNKKTDKIRTDK